MTPLERQKPMSENFRYPRRQFIRGLVQQITKAAFWTLCDFQIDGRENFPEEGPLLVTANHFSFVDPVAVIRSVPWPIEYLGGAEFPHAPAVVQMLPEIWGYYPVFRGTGSRYALRAAESILAQDGVVGIMPEGGSWAEVLRPARPGTAYLAARTGARVLPIGLYGLNEIFPVRPGNRPEVHVRIGEPIGPFTAQGRGRERREQLESIGESVMEAIARLLPDRYRGYLAEDPAHREAALGTEMYPWKDKVEGQVEGEVH
jgi:1-acyl-sn-glycerol-3-phosphate acyltransferase